MLTGGVRRLRGGGVTVPAGGLSVAGRRRRRSSDGVGRGRGRGEAMASAALGLGRAQVGRRQRSIILAPRVSLVRQQQSAVRQIKVLSKSDTHTRAHPFNGPFSRTTRVGRYQKGKTNLDFTEARGSEWQWHQLGCMQVCTSLQTDNHASTPPFSFLQAGCPSCRTTNSVKALKASKSKVYGYSSSQSNVPHRYGNSRAT